ncbi:MAG: P27 family phage terminase small subunit [Clostridium sp.]|nr:P27 family phage terminase small subunit [Clostridium sp.]MCM1400245.1 P27 family phage terminase small subunit [Clostridium sp.]MCM1460958.1 P27 family phage terminase small subunit [Bacteroides sp.]
MQKAAWKKRIKAATEAVGTYKEAFAPVIETLAIILAERDKTYAKYVEKGAESVVEYTNKNGSTNLVKNPLLVTLNDLNAQALSYWRDLGLTPAGLKKIDEAAVKSKKTSALGEVLKSLGG